MEHKYVKEALSYYNIPESEAVLLRHNENMTFRVGTDYLLQIHVPVEGFQTQHIFEGANRIALCETELKFLLYLKERGMVIREPIENCDGELMTKLDNGIMVTVSKWIEGESLDKLEMTSEYCSRIGELTAALHIKTIQRTCDVVGIALQKVQDEFLVLHADLSPSNILAAKSGLVAIDFSLFGMGHPMFDLANLFGTINGLVCRQKIAEGYRSAGGVIYYEALDACFVLSILESIAIHFAQWSRQDWFEDRLKRWCKESFVPFCSGERLFADDFYLIHAGG